MKKVKLSLPKPRKIKQISFVDRNGLLNSQFQPAVFCDTSFLLDYWNSDKYDTTYSKYFEKIEIDEHIKIALNKYFDPDTRTKKLFELRKLIDNFETDFSFIYSPVCRYELEEIITYSRFKTFVTEKYEISAVEKKGRKEIGNIVRQIKIDHLKNLDNPSREIQELFFYLLQSTSFINDGLPGFLEVDIKNIGFTKKDFYNLYFFANQQMGFTDLFHLISAKKLGCKYFFTFDSDYEQSKDDIKKEFDITVLRNIDEMIRLIKK